MSGLFLNFTPNLPVWAGTIPALIHILSSGQFFPGAGPLPFLMEHCICIHAHFYQPPRENPWLEAVERQESAYPYHDWNERITAECYAPNGASRILDEQGYIRQIVNNYSRISLNFGPTLLKWMEDNSPETYQCILESD